MSPRKAFAASGRALKDLVDGGSELERENVMGECKSMRFITKMKREKYLRMRQRHRLGTRAGGLRGGGASLGADEK